MGSVPAPVAQRLQGYPAVFSVCPEPGRVELHPDLVTPPQRTAAVGQVLGELRELGAFPCLREWRDEHYEVRQRFWDPPLFSMERAATALLGVRCYGAHVNGYTWRGDQLCMWLGRRALTKPTYPGQLDNLAAGGIAVGLGVRETLLKECQEEACIPPALAAQARPVGTISYTYEDSRGIFPECQFVFDLELPEAFKPRVGDGEMQEFYLLGLDEVKEAIASRDFKPNCALVALDFLIRHGHIQPDREPHYPELIEGLHRPL